MSSTKSVNDMTDAEITYNLERLRRVIGETAKSLLPPPSQTYIEFVPRKGTVEATVYFRHSDDKKYRMDMEFNLEDSQRDIEFAIVKMYNNFLRDGLKRELLSYRRVIYNP